MSEDELNIKYIREKTGLVKNDELIPIILEMINECLEQSRFDKSMLEKENQQLKKQLELSEKARKEGIELLKLLHYNFPDYDSIHYKIQDIEKKLDIDKGE